MLQFVVASITLHTAALLYALSYRFSAPPENHIIIYATADVLVTLIAIYLANKSAGGNFKVRLQRDGKLYAQVAHSHRIIIWLLVVWASYLAYGSLSLIQSGFRRHDLLSQEGVAGIQYMLLSSTFKMLFPIVVVFKAKLALRILVFCGLILTLIITASRSELAYVLIYTFVLISFARSGSTFRIALKYTVILVIIVFAASLSTVHLQGRASNAGLLATIDIVDDFVRYRAYAFYLADISIEASQSFEKILFPFFGYPSEYALRAAFDLRMPIDSDFVGKLHNLGSNPATGRPYLANILYPWWSWFVGPFGLAGLIIKSIFYFWMLVTTLRYRFFLTSIFLFSQGLIGSTAAHPFLTLTHTISFAVPIVLDLYVRHYRKRNTKLMGTN